MLTFGPLTAFNERTSQPLPGTPIQVFTLDGAPVDTFTLDGAPLTLVSNARGYVGMFQADTTERVLVARARGGNDQPVYAHETLDEAADLAETVNTGRLSEAELKSTIETGVGQVVGPVVSAALNDLDVAAYQPGQHYRPGQLATHTGHLWYALPIDAEQQTTVRTNHVPNPRFVADLAGWEQPSYWQTATVADGALTITLSQQRTNTQALLRKTINDSPATSEGEVWSTAVTISVPASGDPLDFYLGLQFAPTPWITSDRVQVTVEPGQSVTVRQEAVVAPAEKDRAVLVVSASGTVPAGATFTISEPIMEKAPTVGDYFDGDQPDTDDGVTSRDYAWTGAPSFSPSTETTTLTLPRPAPGQDAEAWARVRREITGPGPVEPWNPTPEETSSGSYPAYMSADRTVLFNANSLSVSQSLDSARTWQTIPGTFGPGQSVSVVTELDNGQLLVTASGSGVNDTGASAWISSGYDRYDPSATTWTKAAGISDRARRIRFTGSWGVATHGPIILLAEYGPKQGQADVAPGEHARYVYLSTDYGHTFSTVFDLDTDVPHDATGGHHVHGVAWDPWWDRIWVTWGDDDNGVAYSDDLGDTWHVAYYWGQPAGKLQSVGIVPMPDCILFGSDDAPNGIYRINRAEGKKATGEYEFEVAYAINDSPTRTHLCHAPYRAHNGMAIFPFGMEDVPGYPCIAATRDGYTFETIWTSDHWTSNGRGLRRVLGPTIKGELIAYANDSRFPEYGNTIYRGRAPY